MGRQAKLAGVLVLCGCAPYAGKMVGAGLGVSMPSKHEYFGRSGVQVGFGGGGYRNGFGGSGALQIYQYHAEGTDSSKVKIFAIDLLAGGAGVERLAGGSMNRIIVRGGLGVRLAFPTYDMCASERAELEAFFGLVNPEIELEKGMLMLLSADISYEVGGFLMGAYVRHTSGKSELTLSDDTFGEIGSDDEEIGGIEIGVHGHFVF